MKTTFNKGGFLSPNKNDIMGNSKFNNANNGEKKNFSQTITPLTLKMLNDSLANCTDDNLNIDNHKIDQFVVCARIMEIQDENSRKTIILNDDTGELKCIVYFKGSSDLPAYYTNCNPCEKMYVKVVLSITNYQDKKIFVCQRMDEIKNFNEYCNHLIHVMTRSCARQNPNFEAGEKENNNFQNKNKQPINNNNPKNIEKEVGGILNNPQIMEDEKVYEVLKILCQDNPSGVTAEQVTKLVQSKVDQRKIKVILKKLLDDGYVYSSGDNKYTTY